VEFLQSDVGQPDGGTGANVGFRGPGRVAMDVGQREPPFT
jgi:hypothetical protein